MTKNRSLLFRLLQLKNKGLNVGFTKDHVKIVFIVLINSFVLFLYYSNIPLQMNIKTSDCNYRLVEGLSMKMYYIVVKILPTLKYSFYL